MTEIKHSIELKKTLLISTAKKASIASIFKKAKENFRSYRPVSLPQEVMDQVLLEAISRHMKKKVPGNIQHQPATGKSTLDLPHSFL